MIHLLHAYSDVNLGDRLLVELSLRRLERAGVPASRVTIVALDPESFRDLSVVRGTGTIRGTVSPAVVRAAAASAGTALRGVSKGRLGWGALGEELRSSDGLVGVGGGYLRSGSATEQVGVAINHLPQLMTAARSGLPTFYLPQSIGPLRGPTGRLLRGLLARLDRVCLRDDTSMSEVATPNCRRVPDLAVLEIADNGTAPLGSDDGVMLIGRDLPGAGSSHRERLRALAASLGADAYWAVQAEGASEKSDGAFYASAGLQSRGSTATLLAHTPPAVTVSVRLHGSLMALAAGIPTIHLSYQRKGWAAMRDLGLGEWTHDARSFDPITVASQVRAIRADPSSYWARLTDCQAANRAVSADLDAELRSTFG